MRIALASPTFTGEITMPAMTHRTLALAIMTSLLAACGGGSDYQSGQAPVNAAEVVTSLAPQPYTAGTIRPNHVTQAQLDQQRLSFYQQWKNKYIARNAAPAAISSRSMRMENFPAAAPRMAR